MPLRNNLLSLWKKAKTVNNGWEIFEQNNLLALKAPGKIQGVNFSWEANRKEDIQRLKDFYQDSPFMIFNTHSIDSFIEEIGGFLPEQEDPEMLLNLHQFVYKPVCKRDVTIVPVSTEGAAKLFSEVAGSVFSLPSEGVQAFVTDCLSILGSQYFLLEFQGQPIGTVYVYVDENQHAGVYWMGIAKDYQRQGFGQILLEAALKYAHENGAHTAELYASKEGVGLYEKLAFKVTQKFYIYDTYQP